MEGLADCFLVSEEWDEAFGEIGVVGEGGEAGAVAVDDDGFSF